MSFFPAWTSESIVPPNVQVAVSLVKVQAPIRCFFSGRPLESFSVYSMVRSMVEWNLNSGGRVIVKESPVFTCAFDASHSNLSKARPLVTLSAPSCSSSVELILVRLRLVTSIWGLTAAAVGAASPWTTIPRAARSATATPATLDLTALDNRLLIDVCMLSPFAFIRRNRDTSNAGRMRVSSLHANLQRNPTTATGQISSILQHGNV